MEVLPSSDYETVVDTGETGLVGTIGTVLIDNLGATTQGFSDADVVESPVGSGVYAAPRISPGVIGQYTIVWTRGLGGETMGIDDLFVTGTPTPSVVPADAVSGWGPCSSWIAGDDVLACGALEGVDTDASVLDGVAATASSILYFITGGQFPGRCTRTVRPCRNTCGCWPRSSGIPFQWAWTPYGGAWLASDGCGNRCGCGSTSEIKLAGIPIGEIVQVKIDGAVLDPSGYELQGRMLVRMSDPGPPVVRHRWPDCQDLTLDDDQPGTFSVTYTWGAYPPQAAKDAAAALARELWKACNGQACKLPAKATRVIRQGVTVERATTVAEMIRGGSTGLAAVDAFLAAATGPKRPRRRPSVSSPDVRGFGRRVS